VTKRTGHMGYTFRFCSAGGVDAVESEFGNGRAASIVAGLLDGEATTVSTRYLKKNRACPELPRPHTTPRGAGPISFRCAMSRVAGGHERFWRQHPISPDIADVVMAQRVRLACSQPLPHDAGHDPQRARQTRAEGCCHAFSEWSWRQPHRPPTPEGLPS